MTPSKPWTLYRGYGIFEQNGLFVVRKRGEYIDAATTKADAVKLIDRIVCGY